jgi:hypothetical protein
MRKYFKLCFCWRIETIQKVDFKISRKCTQLIEKKLLLHQVPTQVKECQRWTSNVRKNIHLRDTQIHKCTTVNIMIIHYENTFIIIKTCLAWLRHLSRLSHVILHKYDMIIHDLIRYDTIKHTISYSCHAITVLCRPSINFRHDTTRHEATHI